MSQPETPYALDILRVRLQSSVSSFPQHTLVFLAGLGRTVGRNIRPNAVPVLGAWNLSEPPGSAHSGKRWLGGTGVVGSREFLSRLL